MSYFERFSAQQKVLLKELHGEPLPYVRISVRVTFVFCFRLDLTFFVLFPILFFIFNILYWSAVMYWRQVYTILYNKLRLLPSVNLKCEGDNKAKQQEKRQNWAYVFRCLFYFINHHHKETRRKNSVAQNILHFFLRNKTGKSLVILVFV